VIEGKAINISSLEFDFSRRIYIDGQIMGFNEAQKMPNSDNLVLYIGENDGLRKVIKTRIGSFEEYREGDRNISLRKKE